MPHARSSDLCLEHKTAYRIDAWEEFKLLKYKQAMITEQQFLQK